jgi:transposase
VQLERTRYWQRLEKLLEDTLSTRDMIEALIAGERDPCPAARAAARATGSRSSLTLSMRMTNLRRMSSRLHEPP